jgi:two-component system cell cycle response regulator
VTTGRQHPGKDGLDLGLELRGKAEFAIISHVPQDFVHAPDLGEQRMTALPRTAEPVGGQSKPGTDAAESANGEQAELVPKILVVDDEEVVCKFLKRVLDGGGHRVEVSYGGPEALQKLEQDSFDLVITDLKMPGVDGIGVLRKAKELDPLCEVIVITAYASVESAVEVMKLGAYDYISKPFNVDRIRFVVDKALEKRRLLQAAGERDFYKRLSQLDGLTEVYNRRTFEELLTAEISRSNRFRRPLSLLMVDLDQLKVINDNFGHQAGDVVLKEVAWSLKRSVRNCDVVARYGGDEFAIILVETGKTDAMTTANRLSRLIVVPTPTKGAGDENDHAMTISIGVASYPTDASTRDELVRRADVALYEAKASGGNCVSAAHS